MAKIYYEKDAKLDLLKGKTIGIIGFGSQGHAHAQNLRDSGCRVVVASRKGGEGWNNADKAGFRVADVTEVTREADIVVMLVPDVLQPKVYRESIEKQLSSGKMLMFAHGFNIH
ncbi:MAG TPA: ketol-acid reductoisomerase, partial [Dehalococcoidia bacterium]|nr:ketol-acid reductoisomerase [Dehalococcoidia bacterium]